ncbi:baseplate J/gp47 family protein [Psychrobacter sp. AOP7-A1-24]|uniref:baseplate J/gp47 family protein n=1 Tax=Psychrobacter sp. AOP7-A1-24 TaxID=3457646 RepID=UPI00402B2AB2
MTQLTNNGFERTRLVDRLAEIQSKARAVFGQDIDLSSDTMDGQHLGIFSEAIGDLDELAELVWQSFDPDLASGASLSRIAKISGIERSQGSYSIAELTLTGKPQALIPQGSVVTNENGSLKFFTVDDVKIGLTGTATINAIPENMGPVSAPADTLTSIRTPIYGWDSVTNVNPASMGKNRETDQQLRLRRRDSVNKGNRNMIEALWAALSDLDGVADVAVIENNTNVNNNIGMPPHSIQAVVKGGDDKQIARTIWTSKTGGTEVVGSAVASITDLAGNIQDIKFTRPSIVEVRVKVNITPRAGWSHKTAIQIRNAIFEFINSENRIGESLVPGTLFTPLMIIGGFSINKIFLARKGFQYAEETIDIGFSESVIVDINNIEIVQS